MKILETDRFVLRTWQSEDIAPMTAMNQDPNVMEYSPALQDFEKTQWLIEKFTACFEKHGYTFYAAELKKDHTFIGFVGLF